MASPAAAPGRQRTSASPLAAPAPARPCGSNGSTSARLSHPPLSKRLSSADRRRERCGPVRAASAAADQPPGDNPSTNAASYARVLGPTALALLLCNMDRICMSVAIMPMAAEFGWAPSVQGVVQSAFLYGYMANQVIGGALADKHGGKVVMAWSVFWFSVASVLMPLCVTPAVAAAGLALPAVLLLRALVGLGEGVALPAMNNLVARHIPPARKATALGNCFTGFHCGNLAGLLLSPWLLVNYGWRALFLVFGLLGGPLLLLWQAIVPDKPPQAGGSGSGAVGASGSAAGVGGAAAENISVWQMLSKAPTWAIIIVNFVNHWGYFIYLNWMPSYFARTFSADLRASGLLSFLPWLVMAAGSSAAGVAADFLVNSVKLPVVTVRKLVQTISFLIPAAALLALCNPGIGLEAAVVCMTVALGTTSLGQAGFVANMSDIAPQHAGKMFGLCNTFGSLAGILGVTAVGFAVEMTGGFEVVFKATAALYVLGVVVWNWLCVGERVF